MEKIISDDTMEENFLSKGPTNDTVGSTNLKFENYPLLSESCFEQGVKALQELNLSDVWMTAVEHGYDIHSILGEGSYGKVIKARCRKTGNFVAVKMINKVR